MATNSSNKKNKTFIATLVFICIFFAGLVGWFKYDAVQTEREYMELQSSLTQAAPAKKETHEQALLLMAHTAELGMKEAKEREERELAIKSEQEIALSSSMPLHAEKPIRPISLEKLPSSFSWLANLPFGVGEQQFSDTFKGAKCFSYDGRTCSLEKISAKCIEGVNSPCNKLLLGFDSANGLKSITAEYLSREEFVEFLNSIIATFGEGNQKSFDMRPQVNMHGVNVKWQIEGGELVVNMTEGINANSEYYRSHTFGVTKE